MELLLQLLINGMISSAVYSLLAVGFGIVYRSLKFFNISYGALYLVASYSAIYFANKLNMPFVLNILMGITVAVVISILIEKLVFIPFEKKEAGTGILFVVSLGVFIIIQNFIAMFFGNDIKTLSFPLEGSLTFGEFVITKIQIAQLLVGFTVVILFWLLTKKSVFFKSLWAMGDNPSLIKVLGYPYYKMRIILFSLSAVFVSLASFLTTIDIGIDPHVGMKALLIGAVAVIVGGINNFWGWVVGAILIGVLESVSVWKLSSNWSELVIYSLLIITLLFKPEGIFNIDKRKG